MVLNHCYIGDCRVLLKQFAVAGVSAQTCVTSPPYFGLRDYGVDGQIGLEPTPAEYVAELVSVLRFVRDILADDGTLWLNLGDSYAGSWGAQSHRESSTNDSRVSKDQIKNHPKMAGVKPKDLYGIPWRVAFALQADGWYLRSDIIWHKPNPMPESVTDRPTKAHEYLFLLAKSQRYYYDADAIAEQATWDPPNGTQTDSEKYYEAASGRDDAGRKANGFGFYRSGNSWGPEKRNRRSVWSVTTQPFDGAHFAVFPRTLIEPCILAGSRVGDVVLDPFMGSGTTAQVAEHLGRQWIGCELNPAYLPLQKQRIAQRAMVLE